MKKSIALLVAVVLAMSTVTNVFAKEEDKPVFETDVLSSYEEGYISVYGQKIHDQNEERASVNCIGLCDCIELYHILERSPDANFYSSFFYGNYLVNPIGKVYKDCSGSMTKLFSTETSNILNNLSPFINQQGKKIKDIFKYGNSNLYAFLDSFKKKSYNQPDKVPIIISDLFNTDYDNESNWLYDGEIVFCVPFASTNKEYVLHCEKIVNDILWNHSFMLGDIYIFVVYTDNVIVEYSNGYFNGNAGFIKIYVP